jgi:uncharacterized protein
MMATESKWPVEEASRGAAWASKGLRGSGGSIYNFAKPINADSSFFADPLFPALIATPAFRRLRSIRFLGAIDFKIDRSSNPKQPGIRYSRYQHSLGVARLALVYARLRDLSFEDRRLVTAAALLHDIGHAPLSHSLEPIFRECFGLEHHQATSEIISGKVHLGKEVHQALRHFKVDLDRLFFLLSRKDTSFDGFFSGPINFDTIEAILRSRRYLSSGLLDPSPDLFVEAATLREHSGHEGVIDSFWAYKNDVYKNIIGSPWGIVADYVSQQIMREHIECFSRDAFYDTEVDLFSKVPYLYKFLTNRNSDIKFLAKHGSVVLQKLRTFTVDAKFSFFARADDGRYKQARQNCAVSFKREKIGRPKALLEFSVHGSLCKQ